MRLRSLALLFVALPAAAQEGPDELFRAERNPIRAVFMMAYRTSLGVDQANVALVEANATLTEVAAGIAGVAEKVDALAESLDLGAEGPQLLVHALVAAVDLADVVDLRLVPSDASAAMSSAMPARTSGLCTRPPRSVCGPHDHHPVRVAQDDLGAHVLAGGRRRTCAPRTSSRRTARCRALRRDGDHDGHQVGRELRPGRVVDLRDVAVDSRV
jgi:hypothetical protein